MTKVQTHEINGDALNWVVATLEKHEWRYSWMIHENNYKEWQSIEASFGNPTPDYCYDWAKCGPIIDRENIAISPAPDGLWKAYIPNDTMFVTIGVERREVFKWKYKECGYSPLIAAMRCYVMSKLGEEVDIPDELMLCSQ